LDSWQNIPSEDKNIQLEIIPSTLVITVGRNELENDEAAAILDVEYIVRGSLIQKRNYCLIEVRLFRAGVKKPRRSYRRRHLWDDVLNNSVVEQSVEEISSGISSSLSFDIRLPRRNSKAKELYWRGIRNLEAYNNTRKPESAREARRLFQDAVIKDGNYEEARFQLGFLDILRWETNGNSRVLKDSLDIWRDVRRRNEHDPVALSETGYTRFMLGEDKAAAMDYVFRAIEVAPDHPLANNVLALLYLYIGYYEASVKLEKDKVISADPAYVYPLTNAALSLQLMGQHDLALSMAQKAQDVDPNAFVAVIMAGAQFFYRHRLEDTNMIWHKGYENAVDEIRPIFEVLLAWILAVNGDTSAASVTLSMHRSEDWIQRCLRSILYLPMCAVRRNK
jgi:tetratricopeptide (TPR) repeat protein